MKERPILFSAPMVRAILDGTKAQTRRVVKPQPYVDAVGNACWNGSNFGQSADKVPHFQSLASPLPSSKTGRVRCPFGAPGDRLWVREAWRTVAEADSMPPRDLNEAHRLWFEVEAPHQPGAGKYRPPMFMPRWASRITLEITGVRAERLQDISEADAVAEGATWSFSRSGQPGDLSVKAGFQDLWESINGPDSWAANPWVWVVEFKRLEQPT